MHTFKKHFRLCVIARSVVVGAVFCAAFFMMIVGGCASGKSSRPNLADAPDNEQCNYMREVCAEADRFQANFDRMDREEREDARVVLQGYINQCSSMQELCLSTMQ